MCVCVCDWLYCSLGPCGESRFAWKVAYSGYEVILKRIKIHININYAIGDQTSKSKLVLKCNITHINLVLIYTSAGELF